MPGVILVLGEARFLAGEAVRAVLARAGGRDVHRCRGAETSSGAVLDELRTPALFGDGRVVVVEEANPLLEGESLKAIAKYAEAPVSGNLLVLVAAKLDGRYKAAKQLKSHSKVVTCRPPATYELAGWLRTRAQRAHDMEIGAAAADALLARLGEDLAALDGALGRLKEQIAPRTRIEVADITGSTAEQRAPVLFEAANAVEARDKSRAFEALEAAFAGGVRIRQEVIGDAAGVGPILLGNLHRAWTKLLRFHLLRAQGQSDQEAARAVGVSPKAAPFFLRRVGKWRLEELVVRHGAFARADLALKSGGGTPRHVLGTLLVELLA